MVKSDLQTLMRQFEGYLYDCTREIRYWFIAIRVTRRTFGMLYNTCAHWCLSIDHIYIGADGLHVFNLSSVSVTTTNAQLSWEKRSVNNNSINSRHVRSSNWACISIPLNWIGRWTILSQLRAMFSLSFASCKADVGVNTAHVLITLPHPRSSLALFFSCRGPCKGIWMQFRFHVARCVCVWMSSNAHYAYTVNVRTCVSAY